MQAFLNRHLNRRTVLRGAGVSLGLPWLSAMQSAVSASTTPESPKRFISTTLGLGLVEKNLNPTQVGKQYESTAYLRPLSDLRDDFTVVSGSSHPGVTGGHRAEASILTARPMGTSGQVRNSISLDQAMARHLDGATRFGSLVLATDGSSSPCYTQHGAMIPPLTSASRLFENLFVDPSAAKRQQQAEQVASSRSIMDLVSEDARSLRRELGSGDRDRLDAYFTSVRELEQRLAVSESWATRPKPVVDAAQPRDVTDPKRLIDQFALMCDVIKLALQTDSTRVVSLHIPASGGVLEIDGVDQGYHSLSHHGMDEEKLAQLRIVERTIVSTWGDLIRDLKSCVDGESTLLDQTALLMTSNLGNASNHSNKNMPVLVGGGAFRHVGHLAFDRDDNYPLSNLFVSFAQHMGMETDRFSSGRGTMRGLELSG